MNALVSPFRDLTTADQLLRRHRLQVVPLSEEVAAAYFDTSADAPLPRATLSACTGDMPLCLPLIASDLARIEGGTRHVILVPLSARSLCQKGFWVSLEGDVVAEIDPSALQSPLVDPMALMAGLAPDGGRRLLHLLLTTGPSLFGKTAFGGFLDIIKHLLESLTPASLPLRSWCPMGNKVALASYVVPRGFEPSHFADLVELRGESMRRITGFHTDIEMQGADRLLHLFLPQGLAEGATLVALSDAPLRLSGPAAQQPQRALGPWLARRTRQTRRQIRNWLMAMAERDASASALLMEIACPEAEHPQAVPHHLSLTPGGIFYAIGVNDPHALLRGLVLRMGETTCHLPIGTSVHHPKLGRIQIGYIPGVAGLEPGVSLDVAMHYRSGRLASASTATLHDFTGSLPSLLIDLPVADIAPSLAGAFAHALPARPKLRARMLSAPAETAAVKSDLIVELGTALDYPHALAASLGQCRDLRMILHHPDPTAVPILLRLGQELRAIYGFDVAIAEVVNRAPFGSERMRAILNCSQAPVSILLGQDALPEGSGWLSRWEEVLGQEAPALAAACLTGRDGVVAMADKPGAAARSQHLPVACLGLNHAARTAFCATPVRVPGADADIALYAADLRLDSTAKITSDFGLGATAYAAATHRSPLLRRVEDLIAMESNPMIKGLAA